MEEENYFKIEKPQGGRYSKNLTYPRMAYIEMLGCYMLSNFVYHQNCYRRNNNKFSFCIFLFVNMFTCYNLVEVTNNDVLRFYAAEYNDKMEN